MRIILRYGGAAEASKSYFGEPVCEIIVGGDKSILPMETQQQRPPYALIEGLKLENRLIRGNNDESIAVRKSARPTKGHQVKLAGPPPTPTTKR